MHHRRPFLDHPDPRMAMAVDPTLVPLGHAKPPLQVQVRVPPIFLRKYALRTARILATEVEQADQCMQGWRLAIGRHYTSTEALPAGSR
jgi:hypothetical protein